MVEGTVLIFLSLLSLLGQCFFSASFTAAVWSSAEFRCLYCMTVLLMHTLLSGLGAVSFPAHQSVGSHMAFSYNIIILNIDNKLFKYNHSVEMK